MGKDLMGLTDEQLGANCRKMAEYLSKQKIEGYESVSVMSAIFLLCSQLQISNIAELTLELEDVSSELFPISANFKITIEKNDK